MKMKDVLWILILLSITGFVIYGPTRTVFEQFTTQYPYLMGFIKTALLATMGELLVSRIRTRFYFSEKGIYLKMIVWGFLGMIFVLIFKVFSTGIQGAQTANLLPVIGSNETLNIIWLAFLTSLIMNLFFAPSFMLLHRFTDTMIEQAQGSIKNFKYVKLNDIIESIDFKRFFGFVVFKTIPFFWIPAHTITFVLPETYRVLMASYLSIVLGILLTMARKTTTDTL